MVKNLELNYKTEMKYIITLYHKPNIKYNKLLFHHRFGFISLTYTHNISFLYYSFNIDYDVNLFSLCKK